LKDYELFAKCVKGLVRVLINLSSINNGLFGVINVSSLHPEVSRASMRGEFLPRFTIDLRLSVSPPR